MPGSARLKSRQRVTTYSRYAISSNVTGIKNIEAQTLAGRSVQKIYFRPDIDRGVGLGDQVVLNPAVDLADGSKVQARARAVS
jgi:hypothetical protein